MVFLAIRVKDNAFYREMNLDYIIIGQGISGSLLAYYLIKYQKRILVIDDPKSNVSTSVAAGIYNPITGRRMVRTWNAHLLFPFLIREYGELENVLGVKFMHPVNIYRPFTSIAEQNDWMAKANDPMYRPFVVETKIGSDETYPVNDPFGGVVIDQSGYIDLPKFLGSFCQYLTNESRLREEYFDDNELEIHQHQVKYRDLVAKKIIFCDGTHIKSNQYFNWLPFRLVKGELIDIKSDAAKNNIIIRGIFVLPLGSNFYRVGATYDWENQLLKTTDEAKIDLGQKFEELTSVPYEVVGQQVGLRPTTKDRRPFIGLHPKFEPIGILNGLGTKGISLAPYYANQFVEYLENGRELDSEVNIARYFSLYYLK